MHLPVISKFNRKKSGLPPYFRKNYIHSYLMLLIPMIGFLLFSAYPIIWMVKHSFYTYDGVSWRFEGILENYITILSNPIFLKSILNTFIFFGKLLVEIPLAFILALLLNRALPGRNFIRGAIFLPNVTSIAVMAVVFYVLLQPFSGFINQFMINIGILAQPVDWLGSRWMALGSCMLISIWKNLGLNMLLILAGLQTIPTDFYEAGELEGITFWQKIRMIIIPYLRPYLQVIVMLGMIGTLKVADLIIVLTNGGPGTETEVMMSFVYHRFFGRGGGNTGVLNLGEAAAGAVIAGSIIAIVTLIYLYINRRSSDTSNIY
ncbi:MAG: carbohydrate ABC transporter permease [Halanaerobiales bacterium]